MTTEGLISLMSTALGLGAAGALLYFTVISFIMELWRVRRFPGPFAVPVLGNLYDKSAFSFIGWLSNLRRKHGKIFRVFTGPRPYIVLMDKVAAREVLSNPRVFAKGPDYEVKFGYVFGDGLVTSSGDKHKADRAFFGKYFTPEKVKSNLPKFCAMTSQHITQTIDKFVGEHAGGSYNLELFFPELALNMFCRFALNTDIHNPAEASKLASYGSNVIGEHIVLGIPIFTWLPRIKKTLEGLRKFCGQLDTVIDARVAAKDRGDTVPDDTLTAMIDSKMTRKQMHSHLVTMVAAGHDTTSYCAMYCIYLLAKNPHVQHKLKQEVKRVLGNRTELTSEDYENLTYARNCFQETLRIFSVVPHVTRLCTQETKLEGPGVTIPKGVEVLVPICLLNRDVDEWGGPVEQFDPDRFKGITREAPKKGYFPFGYSTRSCIGATLALVEGTVMVSLLAQKFTFREDPSFKLALKSGITMVAAHGVNVIVEPDDEYAIMNVDNHDLSQ